MIRIPSYGAWIKSLVVNPKDTLNRSVFADCLEDHNYYRQAAGQRWLIKYNIYPRICLYTWPFFLNVKNNVHSDEILVIYHAARLFSVGLYNKGRERIQVETHFIACCGHCNWDDNLVPTIDKGAISAVRR